MESNSDKKFTVTYQNNIYDITEFIHKHPGGINTLKGLNGTDMTQRFSNGPPHSDAAKYLMNEYKIKNKINGLKNGIIQTQTSFDENNHINGMMNGNGMMLKSSDQINNNEIDLNHINLDESMECLVDWSKPMLGQITSISEYYNEWVHKPVDKSLRLFGPWYLEMLTKTPWWVIPIFWIPNIFYIMYSEIYSPHNIFLTKTKVSFHFFMGIFLWTLIEYTLHRWVFHIKISPRNKKLCVFHFLIHGLHHKVPFDPYRLVFPPLPAVILASILYLPVLLIFPYPRITVSGGLLGYLCYDMMHYYLHYGNPKIWHMYHMKRYHYQHHFAHQDIGFGITSPLWDSIFSTQIYLRKLKFRIVW